MDDVITYVIYSNVIDNFQLILDYFFEYFLSWFSFSKVQTLTEEENKIFSTRWGKIQSCNNRIMYLTRLSL